MVSTPVKLGISSNFSSSWAPTDTSSVVLNAMPLALMFTGFAGRWEISAF
nr:hypothetical protein [Solemya velesiana gill symbiont]